MFIPERLNDLMDARNVTAYKISKAIGCSNTSVANWRNGLVSPDSENIRKLADFFDVSIAYFFEEKPATPEGEQPVNEFAARLAERIMNLPPKDRERAIDYLELLERSDNIQEP